MDKISVDDLRKLYKELSLREMILAQTYLTEAMACKVAEAA